jgi:hypothetical protein
MARSAVRDSGARPILAAPTAAERGLAHGFSTRSSAGYRENTERSMRA